MNSVREQRRLAGLSQRELAAAAGVDRVTVIHIETGQVSPHVDTLQKLADAIGCELSDFFPKAQAALPFGPPEPRGVDEAELRFPYAVVLDVFLENLEELLGENDWPDSRPALGVCDAALDLCAGLLVEIRTDYFRDLPESVRHEVGALAERSREVAKAALRMVEGDRIGSQEAEKRREQMRVLSRQIA